MAAEDTAEAPLEGLGDTRIVDLENVVLAAIPSSVNVDVLPYITVDGWMMIGTII